MIPYFKGLGVTSLELLPVQEFDLYENPRTDPQTGKPLSNYWGYSTMAFFAPKGRYSSSGSVGEQVAEFKEMVRALHAAGIEVILDIVFNHSAEGNELGPTLSFRGLDNRIYYMLDEDKRYYKNYSGCGNTLNCNHPVVRTLIRDCLHYWVVEMHVDGFRFDLGSILGRDQAGQAPREPADHRGHRRGSACCATRRSSPRPGTRAGPTRWAGSPAAAGPSGTTATATTFAASGAATTASARSLATRITGSSDLYLRDGRKPFHSINFITAHDGFTLNDLVSYERKHNERNGEERQRRLRREPTRTTTARRALAGNAALEAIRNKQAKNFLATLLLSIGTPMLLGGDEFRRTQGGNNNAYCQDNETSWFDWEAGRAP